MWRAGQDGRSPLPLVDRDCGKVPLAEAPRPDHGSSLEADLSGQRFQSLDILSRDGDSEALPQGRVDVAVDLGMVVVHSGEAGLVEPIGVALEKSLDRERRLVAAGLCPLVGSVTARGDLPSVAKGNPPGLRGGEGGVNPNRYLPDATRLSWTILEDIRSAAGRIDPAAEAGDFGVPGRVLGVPWLPTVHGGLGQLHSLRHRPSG
jgi:hypothetical protein